MINLPETSFKIILKVLRRLKYSLKIHTYTTILKHYINVIISKKFSLI